MQNAKKLVSLFTSVIFMCSTVSVHAKAKDSKVNFQQEYWNILMARIVSHQPNRVGGQKFFESLGMKSNTKPGVEFFMKAAKIKNWPEVAIEGNAIKISGADTKTVMIEMGKSGTGAMLINGREIKLDMNKPILNQVEKFLNQGAGKSAFHSDFSFFPAAHAQGLGEAVADAVVVAGVSFAAFMVTVAVTFGGSMVAVGAVAATGVAATGASIVCGVGVAAGYVKGNSMGERFLNCTSKPLSWMGLNPRDRLYLTNLECGDDSFAVSLLSSSGIKEDRTFRLNDSGKLKSIEMQGKSQSATLFPSEDQKRIESGQSGAGRRLMRPKNEKDLDEAQTLLQDFEYYSRVCNDPQRREQIQAAIRSGNESVRAYDQKTPAELSSEAVP